MIEELIRTSLTGFSARSILDIGPGYADFSRLSARLTGAERITFVDSDPAVLQFQRDECSRAHIEAGFTSFDFADTQRITNTERYNLIHCQEVLEHLTSPRTFLDRISSMLLPGGRMIITVPTGISERWLKRLNPGYMRNELHGHVQEFEANDLRRLAEECGLRILEFVPAQPQYFVAHTWMALTRMKVEGATGKLLTGGVRASAFSFILRASQYFFRLTGERFWGKLLPRNYFVLAERPL
jgi:cyclopropane fatty-acyl-phospholipid synthase-like methyltransferase